MARRAMRGTCKKAEIAPGGAFQTLAIGSAIVGTILTLGGIRMLFEVPAILPLGLVALTPALLHRRVSRPREDVPVEATSAELRVGDRRFAVRRLAGAWARDAITVVAVLEDRTRIVLELEGASSDDVLTALGWDATMRTLSAPLRRALGPFTIGFLSFAGTAIASVSVADALPALRPFIFWLLLASFVLSAVVARVFGSPRVVLGADGLRVEDGLTRRFVRYAEIAQVDGHEGGLVLRLVSGKELRLPMVAEEQSGVAAVRARIEAGRAASRDGAAGLAAVLARGGREIGEWRASLASLASRQGGFRDAAITADALDRELGDARAPDEVRVAAALVLEAMEPGGRRVRVASKTCANPELRAAFEAVAEGELDDERLSALSKNRQR